ncbi:MAG: prepilin peptidase [Candidatus Levybacteria bacterium]|nr:prepilin peptidase [Candidatus Levybacteria bacterium]
MLVSLLEMIFILLFILGLAVGSFLNVLIYRLPRNLSIFGRSFCPHCKKKIAWHDNIPLLSFAILGGKCRYCRSPISLQYPIVELTTAILFVLVFLFPNESIKYQVLSIKYLVSLGYYLLIISSLVAIFFIDLKHGIIPDKIVYPAVVISLFFLISQYLNILISHFLSATASFLFFFLLVLITRGRSMGMGDVKLAFLMGLFLGFPKIVIALYVAFLTGAAVSLILVLWGKKKFSGGTVPFGPFLVFGTLLAFFFGEVLLRLASPWLNF